MRRAGEEGLFETLAQANIDALAGCSFNRIVTTDPRSLNVLRQEYATMGANYEVLHYTQLLDELLALGDAEIFVVACPKDTVMYTAAVQSLGAEDRIAVRDVIDLIEPAGA